MTIDTTVLGRKATDKIDGFTGIITGVTLYIDGRVCYCIEAKASHGKSGSHAWTDATRVAIDTSAPPISLDD